MLVCFVCADLCETSYLLDYTLVSEDSSNPPSRPGSPDIMPKPVTTKLIVSTTKVTYNCKKY